MIALPTRADEDFRYADLTALAQAWPVAVEDFVVPAGESLALQVVLEGAAPVARHLAIRLNDGARCDVRVLNLAQAYGRVAITVELGARAHFMLGGAQIGGADQVQEIVTTVVHAAPDAVSHQVVRSVVGGQATANYLGKVHVKPGADGTDGEQSVRAMLLARTATANARPELEIHADDVKCAHGCAVGELDPAALFYMAQRGLPPETAKRLMLQAFVAEAFVDAADGAILTARAVAALEAML